MMMVVATMMILMVTISLRIPCLLYIDDRHICEHQVPLDKGEYSVLGSDDERNLAAAKGNVLLVFYLVRLRYFLGF